MRMCRCTPHLTCLKVIPSYLVSNHTPNFNAIGPAVVELPMKRVSPTLSPRTCHVPWQAPAGIGAGQILGIVFTECAERSWYNVLQKQRHTGPRFLTFSKYPERGFTCTLPSCATFGIQTTEKCDSVLTTAASTICTLNTDRAILSQACYQLTPADTRKTTKSSVARRFSVSTRTGTHLVFPPQDLIRSLYTCRGRVKRLRCHRPTDTASVNRRHGCR